MYLYALLPPGNISAEIVLLKKELFLRYGMVSARAVPPLFPLKWSPVLPSSGNTDLKQVAREAEGLFQGRTEPELTGFKGALFLPVSVPSALTTIMDSVFPDISRDDISPPFPVFSGFFMGSLSEPAAVSGRFPISRDSLSWKRGELVCFDFQTAPEPEWWTEVRLSGVFLDKHARG